jgi:glycolate oxidase FAD binding subunit
MKLYTGSLGTLGIITQVTLKVKPLPEASRWVVIPAVPDDIPELLARLSATRTRPCAITIRGRAMDGRIAGASVVAGFEDNARAVEWQVARLPQELPDRAREHSHAQSGQEADVLLAGLRDLPLAVESDLTFKANVLPARTWDFCQRAATGARLAFEAHAGNGIVFGHLSETNLDAAKAYLDELLRFAGQGSGNVVVTRCLTAWKSVLPVWGRPTGDRELMKAVKKKLDPRGVFNPGRFVSGI